MISKITTAPNGQELVNKINETIEQVNKGGGGGTGGGVEVILYTTEDPRWSGSGRNTKLTIATKENQRPVAAFNEYNGVYYQIGCNNDYNDGIGNELYSYSAPQKNVQILCDKRRNGYLILATF